MKSNIIIECLKKIFDNNISEATSTGMARGSYKPPIRPGLTYWDPEDLQPFINSASDYVDAEINYDSLDGHISTPKHKIPKKERIAKEIQTRDFKQDSPVEGDDEYTKAPFKVLVPSYHNKGDKSSKKPRIKDKKIIILNGHLLWEVIPIIAKSYKVKKLFFVKFLCLIF